VNERGIALQNRKVIGLFPELLGVGGVQEVGRLTAAALLEIASSRGWALEFLSLNDAPGPHLLDVCEHRIPLKGFGRAKLRFALAGLRQARSMQRDVDGVVVAAHPNLAPLACWMRSINPRLKSIVISHGIEVWQPLPSFRRRALATADLLLAPSGDTMIKLADVQGVSREKIRKLPWPMNPEFLRLADAATKPAQPASFLGGTVILTVGRWAASERYKGADQLIAAIAQLRVEFAGLHLVAVGNGDDLPRLQKLAADSGVADCVHFLEGLSREQVAACFSRADIFALPSTGEGFGLVFLEAMAFSKPVLGAACGGTVDVIEHDVNGLLVPPGDLHGLVQNLRRLLRDESLRGRLGRRGAEIVREEYRFDVFRGKLESFLGD